jgi:hypothetical protein
MLENNFYGHFKNISAEYFGVHIGVRGYWQMVVTICQAYLGSEYELDVEEEHDALIEQ